MKLVKARDPYELYQVHNKHSMQCLIYLRLYVAMIWSQTHCFPSL